jgi:hypothetical protein
VHAVLTSIGDLTFLLYTSRVYGKQIGFLATVCRLVSWFTLYTSTRSLTNSMEELFTILCVASLDSKRFWPLHVCGFTSFAIRPTAAINLMPIYVYQFFVNCDSVKAKAQFIIQFIAIGYC